MPPGLSAGFSVSIHAPARGATLEAVEPFARLTEFQFTRPRGARRATVAHGPIHPVSIHAPARGATASSGSAQRPCSFQFTRPRGARPGGGREGGAGVEFQFTRPRGARPPTPHTPPCPPSFQFTRPRGARRASAEMLLCPANVSIHAPARGATLAPRRRRQTPRRFNSRAREGRDLVRSTVISDGLIVSIHAPARGATRAKARASLSWRFQFTRPRGARRGERRLRSPKARFNSRAREGRDRRRLALPAHPPQVSIHAPARGATNAARARARQARVSIHAPARGATLPAAAPGRLIPVSIHAPARGATQVEPDLGEVGQRVSIHAPARGATSSCNRPAGNQAVSIHAPARGATFPCLVVSPSSEVSIHAPARGATRRPLRLGHDHRRFNSRAREGRDADLLDGINQTMFQFTRPRGARPPRPSWRSATTRCFNSRAREGRDAPDVAQTRAWFVSIHAPARGATDVLHGRGPQEAVSIHAPARGAT